MDVSSGIGRGRCHVTYVLGVRVRRQRLLGVGFRSSAAFSIEFAFLVDLVSALTIGWYHEVIP